MQLKDLMKAIAANEKVTVIWPPNSFDIIRTITGTAQAVKQWIETEPDLETLEIENIKSEITNTGMIKPTTITITIENP